MNYLPFRPIKNKAFRFYFKISGTSTIAINQDDLVNFSTYSVISKDGGAFIALTNTPTFINASGFAEGFGYIDLTASEMNANVIALSLMPQGVNCDDKTRHYTIYTSGANGLYDNLGVSTVTSAFSPAVLTILIQAINAGYVVAQQDISNDGYNYYGLTKKKNKDSLWIIIREKTDFTEVGYRQTNNNAGFAQAWIDRETLNYSNTVVI